MRRFRNWLLDVVNGPRVGVLIASVWLVCLVFPVHSLLILEDRVHCLVGLLALVLFVPVYLAGFRDLGGPARRGWQALATAAGRFRVGGDGGALLGHRP